jgi:lipoate-protein ligase A
MKEWRFIPTGKRDSYTNMAIDETMFRLYGIGGTPMFRVYGWDPPGLSIGNNQNARETLRLTECYTAGIPVVRRLSGGSAIYHDDEITYSLLCSKDDLEGVDGVRESYKKLCSFLLLFYERLGLEAYFSGLRRGDERPPAFCFSARETYDIVIGGKKIGGNAQKRRGRLIFQHGSIPFSLDFTTIARTIRDVPPDIEEKTTCLDECTGRRVAFPEAERLLSSSFGDALRVGLYRKEITDEESKIVSVLVDQKYALPEWNLFRMELSGKKEEG